MIRTDFGQQQIVSDERDTSGDENWPPGWSVGVCTPLCHCGCCCWPWWSVVKPRETNWQIIQLKSEAFFTKRFKASKRLPNGSLLYLQCRHFHLVAWKKKRSQLSIRQIMPRYTDPSDDMPHPHIHPPPLPRFKLSSRLSVAWRCSYC